jgi:hypothetical protein
VTADLGVHARPIWLFTLGRSGCSRPTGIRAGLTGLIYGAAVGTVSGVVGVIAARRRFRTGVVRCVYIDRKRSAVTLRASCRLKIALLREAPEALADVGGGVQPTRPTGRGR